MLEKSKPQRVLHSMVFEANLPELYGWETAFRSHRSHRSIESLQKKGKIEYQCRATK
jgi:hypothetical protein